MKYVIWSEEHGAWWDQWDQFNFGYTRSLEQAGRYSAEDATEIIEGANRYLDPEKEHRSFNEIAIPDPLDKG